MSTYLIKRSFVDMDNGITGSAGGYVETDNTAWVQRIGKALERVNFTPDDVKPLKVGDTVESQPAAVAEPDADTKALKRPPAKKAPPPARKPDTDNSAPTA